YRLAATVMWYVNCRSEVITQPNLIEALKSDKRTVVPYCTQDEQNEKKLGLWLVEDFSELQPGLWGILEPSKTRRGEPGKEIGPERLDLIMVPGVAFDRSGGRLGNGAGYYDRLLAKVREDCILCGICFESQLLEHIEMEKHDVAMDFVITEKTIYAGRGRQLSCPSA
ncbi:MAG: 5-formyltetrahydrofolate cyclo-ligase, partial [Gammaproteobacteria bacterium]